ncbi:hypothetical protein HZU77_001960 [Neisseriaceae bacterium TC5R-5]|nr:hypothetical protein [Neisseriaceae bacterium TC5R-5]
MMTHCLAEHAPADILVSATLLLGVGKDGKTYTQLGTMAGAYKVCEQYHVSGLTDS